MKNGILRLRAEIRGDRAAVERQLDVLESIDLDPAAPASSVLQPASAIAMALHHAYCGIEAGLLRLAREFDGGEPRGADWHQDLLRTMSMEVESVRPAFLSPESLPDLRALLGFRHFVRHAYAAELDPAQLAHLRRQALHLRSVLAADFGRVEAFLVRLADQGDAPGRGEAPRR